MLWIAHRKINYKVEEYVTFIVSFAIILFQSKSFWQIIDPILTLLLNDLRTNHYQFCLSQNKSVEICLEYNVFTFKKKTCKWLKIWRHIFYHYRNCKEFFMTFFFSPLSKPGLTGMRIFYF